MFNPQYHFYDCNESINQTYMVNHDYNNNFSNNHHYNYNDAIKLNNNVDLNNNMMNNNCTDHNKLSKKRHKKNELANLNCLESTINTKKLKQNHSLKKIATNEELMTTSEENSCDDLNGVFGCNERTRLISINEAFDILRVNIPTFPYERRLSKIDTLHLAISYINLLELVIESNMTMYDYIKSYIYNNSNDQQSKRSKPVWATSDLTVRLNWLNWSSLGIRDDQKPHFLNLFKNFAETKRD